MFELLLNNYNISFNDVFEIKEIKTGRIIGKYYFIQDKNDVFKLCRYRKRSYLYVSVVSSSMTGNILTALMKNKITMIKTNETVK